MKGTRLAPMARGASGRRAGLALLVGLAVGLGAPLRTLAVDPPKTDPGFPADASGSANEPNAGFPADASGSANEPATSLPADAAGKE